MSRPKTNLNGKGDNEKHVINMHVTVRTIKRIDKLIALQTFKPSRSEVVRQAVEQYLDQHFPEEDGTGPLGEVLAPPELVEDVAEELA